MKEDGYAAPIFRPKKDTLNPKTGLTVAGYTPLQAADLWAFELFLADKKAQTEGFQEHFRYAFERLHKMPGEAGCYTAEDVKRTDSLLSQQKAGANLLYDPKIGAYLLP
jgi:hypothetical protein